MNTRENLLACGGCQWIVPPISGQPFHPLTRCTILANAHAHTCLNKLFTPVPTIVPRCSVQVDELRRFQVGNSLDNGWQ